MRKLHELLPITRQYLMTEDEQRGLQEFACVAANVAWDRGVMTFRERDAIRDAIQAEIKWQYQLMEGVCIAYPDTIIQVLRKRGDIDSVNSTFQTLRTAKYIKLRDQWLDEFQTKLAVEQR